MCYCYNWVCTEDMFQCLHHLTYSISVRPWPQQYQALNAREHRSQPVVGNNFVTYIVTNLEHLVAEVAT